MDERGLMRLQRQRSSVTCCAVPLSLGASVCLSGQWGDDGTAGPPRLSEDGMSATQALHLGRGGSTHTQACRVARARGTHRDTLIYLQPTGSAGRLERTRGRAKRAFPGTAEQKGQLEKPLLAQAAAACYRREEERAPRRGSPCASEKLDWAPSGAATDHPGLCVHGSRGGSGFGEGREPSLRGPGVGGQGCGLRGGCGHAARWEIACSEQNPQCLGFLAEGPPRKKQCARPNR